MKNVWQFVKLSEMFFKHFPAKTVRAAGVAQSFSKNVYFSLSLGYIAELYVYSRTKHVRQILRLFPGL